MLESECEETAKLMRVALDEYKKHLTISDFGYYIYISNSRENKIVAIIHGYGTSTEPYNIKFMSTRNERYFFTFDSFKKYLKDEFYVDMISNAL